MTTHEQTILAVSWLCDKSESVFAFAEWTRLMVFAVSAFAIDNSAISLCKFKFSPLQGFKD
jgi:hypothetical protein